MLETKSMLSEKLSGSESYFSFGVLRLDLRLSSWGNDELEEDLRPKSGL